MTARVTELAPGGWIRCWRSKAATPAGYVCTAPLGHDGACLLLYQPGLGRRMWDRAMDVLGNVLPFGGSR